MGQICGLRYPGFVKKKFLLFICLFLIFAFSILQAEEKKDNNKIKIITTIFPLQKFAKAVVGERGEVSLLLPPGAEVHSWRPLVSDMIKLSSADLFIYIGATLEPWIHNILRSVKSPELRVLEASHDFSLIRKNKAGPKHSENKQAQVHNHEHQNKFIDPHIWLDFEYDQMIVDRIEALLSEINPEEAPRFKKNALSYKKKLQELDQKYREGLSNCLERTFILGGHAVFGYLAKRYNLNQISLYGLSPDSKPTPKQLVEVIELAKKHKIKVIYFESYISDKLAKVMAKEVGAKTLVLHSGANITKEQLKSGMTFMEIMEKNLENLRDGLLCR